MHAQAPSATQGKPLEPIPANARTTVGFEEETQIWTRWYMGNAILQKLAWM
jgi:hypothetical protein